MDQYEFTTPIGRMVQGHPMEEQTKNMKGGPLTDKAGNLRTEYFYAIAIPKTAPEWPAIYQQIQAVAQAGFPGGQAQLPTFSWKIIDGDLPPNNTKEGFAGHFIIRCSGGFKPKVGKIDPTTNQYVEILNPAEIKRGDYIRTRLSVKSNGEVTQPGIYVNPVPSVGVQFIAYGEAIQVGPDAAETWGAEPVGALPPGASLTPTAAAPMPGVPAAPPVPGVPAATTPPVPGAYPPPPVPQVPAAAIPPVAPHPGFLNPPAPGAAMTPPPPPVPMTPAPASKLMTPKAAGNTYEMMVAQGWTDEMLVAQGYMTEQVPF